MVISVFLSVCVCVDAKKVYQKLQYLPLCTGRGEEAYIQRQQRERHSLQSHSL